MSAEDRRAQIAAAKEEVAKIPADRRAYLRQRFDDASAAAERHESINRYRG